MNRLAILGLVAAFLLFTLFNQTLLGGLRIDLTQNQLYTLSSGSKQVIDEIDEPINFYFFFSANASRDLTSLRSYASQVEALLKEYELAAAGKIKLSIIDPEPFSADEDLAAEFGLQSVPINNAGEELYFGLAATNALDQEVVIPFFQPDKEAFLEYDLSRTVQTLVSAQLPKIALMSSLKIDGDINMQTFESTPAWMMIEQLRERFDIENIPILQTQIPQDAQLLVLVHPKNLSQETLYGIDQFVMAGGRLLVFLDPFAELDQVPAENPLLAQQVPGAPSDLAYLMKHWGLQLMPNVVVGDANLGLSVGAANGIPVRHLAILGLDQNQFDGEDIAISGVSSMNISSAGIIQLVEPREGLNVEPLISVGPYAAPIPVVRLQMMGSPEELQKDFVATGDEYHLAVRLSGSLSSAFAKSPSAVVDPMANADLELAANGSHLDVTSDANIVIVADTDLLSDRLWVEVQNFFGQRVASPFAGNGDFVFNMVDNLSGSSALISIRSRGEYSRPFNVVQELRREAEAKYLASAEELQAQLFETEARLTDFSTDGLANGGLGNDELLSISPDQEAELLRFQEDKLRIRKQLRDVRHQLDKDIEGLGSTLKFLNILLVPIVLTLALMMLNFIALTGSRKDASAVNDDV